MKAAVIASKGVVEITTVPDPEPGPREVVIGVAACGICGTDLHILQGEFAPSLPIVPGHEFAGEVVEVGREVSNVAVGDQVCVDPTLYCGECHYCRLGRFNLCDNWRAIGVTDPGGAAEFVKAPRSSCVKLPDGVEARNAALVEPLACSVRAFDILRTRLAEHVLIVGSGTMGLMNLQLAKLAGASSVDVVDLNPERLETAVALGCSATATNADELDRPLGWDVVIDATGVIPAIEDGIRRVRKGGAFLQFGVTDMGAEAAIDMYRVYNQEITIEGSMAVLHSYERAAELFVNGVIPPDVFISDRLPLEDYKEALDLLAAGKGRKIQVVPNLNGGGR